MLSHVSSTHLVLQTRQRVQLTRLRFTAVQHTLMVLVIICLFLTVMHLHMALATLQLKVGYTQQPQEIEDFIINIPTHLLKGLFV